jgi:hypothetical protein
MVALLSFPTGNTFASGATHFSYRPGTQIETTPRIWLQIGIEGLLAAAIVDTGAPYVVCSADIAERLQLDPKTALGTERLLIRGFFVGGRLYRLNVRFHAEWGVSLDVEATAFIPNPDWYDRWGDLPSFIGLGGCLARIRFGIDPTDDIFYFGPA